MPRGTLEVVLISAKGIDDNDFLYAGSKPQWNESFLFTVSDSASELNLKIMDKDNFSQDDCLGVATIHLDPVFEAGSIPETAYKVVKDEEYCGEIKVALTFTVEKNEEQDYAEPEESYGGWKESSGEF
uniref:C2 domain-containing protein n=1 Tax=Glycine max TaxID=3847 RepID=A0A368UHX3_SOYBN